MDASMMARMKVLEAENARLKKRYIEEKLKAGIVTEALATKWQGRWLPCAYKFAFFSWATYNRNARP